MLTGKDPEVLGENLVPMLILSTTDLNAAKCWIEPGPPY